MDVDGIVQQMRLDAFAVEVSQCLTAAQVPHALIKGPTTARWLYPAGRRYRDVDLLLPPTALRRATRALKRAGVAGPYGGALGEVASHAQLMRSPAGIELDLHVTLPMMTPGTDPWPVLVSRIAPCELDTGDVPALDTDARCVVIALHALGNGPGDPQAMEDLRRARAVHGSRWAGVLLLAQKLGVAPHVHAAVTLVEGGNIPDDLPADARIRLSGGTARAFQMQRLRELPYRRRPGVLWREAFPTVGFMRYVSPQATGTTGGLARAYARRLTRLLLDMARDWRA